MKTNAIITTIGTTLAKTKFQLKKHSPEILTTIGVVGIVSSTILACKATTKISTIIDKTKEDISTIHSTVEDTSIKEYTNEDAKKDLTIVYAQTGVKMIKLYAPAVMLSVFSISMLLTSHNMLRKRNVALAAAYTAVDTSFKDYRKRVISKFGDEIDKELKYGLITKKIEEISVDENGKEHKTTKEIKVVNPNMHSEYARFFDEASAYWEKNSDYNHMFVNQQQQYANDKLIAQGYLFLNDVYEMIGLPKSKAGQSVGWIYGKNNPVGDNYVDFGIYEIDDERKRAFVNGYERNILLDFNVDGPILDSFEGRAE